jgi:DNA replication protein DnaC
MTSPDIDAARLTLALNELRLPAIKALWPGFAEQADKEGWSAARLLSALVEHELAERDRRRIERHLAQARLLPGKTLESFDFAAVPMLSRAHVSAITAGDSWIGKGNNILLFGPPGVGKSHLGSAIGLTLVQNGYRVLFSRTTDLVQKLQLARRDLVLESAIAKLDKFHLLILDDITYVTKDQAETSVLFELISARYERRSMLITANQPFGAWNTIFPDPAMTLAAVDRLVHHATIFEMNVESYRRKTAEKAKGPGRPPLLSPSCTSPHKSWSPSPCGRLSRPRTTTGPLPPGTVMARLRRCAARAGGWRPCRGSGVPIENPWTFRRSALPQSALPDGHDERPTVMPLSRHAQTGFGSRSGSRAIHPRCLVRDGVRLGAEASDTDFVSSPWILR